MRIHTCLVALGLIAACTTARDKADTTAAAALDTVKAMDSTATSRVPSTSSDTSRPADASVPTTTTTKTTTKTTKTTTTTKRSSTSDTSHLGRDSVIRFPIHDPKHRLPVVKPDTTH